MSRESAITGCANLCHFECHLDDGDDVAARVTGGCFDLLIRMFYFMRTWRRINKTTTRIRDVVLPLLSDVSSIYPVILAAVLGESSHRLAQVHVVRVVLL